MPFKNVSSVRKVASVDGAVTGGAFNRALSSVAISSNNPVQIALLPLNGVNPKVQSVGLDDVSDIALLNRAMAVVKAGDSTWALLDIEHKPKVEELHRDTKAICPKASGGLALGLKWDGSGVEYAPGKNDVAVREFTLRGDTRCADVGETETYAVVDIGEGEFRIHPGTTPEPGSATKIALPAGSKNLDRIRGGKFTSAIYKRGHSNVCLVRRAGNRLEAKMLTLAWPPTDVAVIETTMLVTTADGRIVLFDAESLDKATSSLIEARFEAHLGCRGEPRVMVVANQTLFVGTSTGEILQGAIVRKQATA
jgi:hypothetical protein